MKKRVYSCYRRLIAYVVVLFALTSMSILIDTRLENWIEFLIITVVVTIIAMFRFSTFLITINDEMMIIYSLLKLPKKVELTNIDSIDFEGMIIYGKGKIELLFMTISNAEKKIVSVEMLNISRQGFYQDIVKLASLYGYKIRLVENAESLIVKYTVN